MVGCLQGKTVVNMFLIGKELVNGKRGANEACQSVDVQGNYLGRKLEASPGIEPGYADLQSAASPLRHEALNPSAARASGCIHLGRKRQFTARFTANVRILFS